MAFGFPAYQERIERFPGYARKELLRAADFTLDELGWRPRKGGKWRLVASVPNQMIGIFMTWGAKFIVEVEEEEMFIRSEGSIAIAWVDIGQHSANITKFLRRLEDVLDDLEK
jgi:hypothetical protein